MKCHHYLPVNNNAGTCAVLTNLPIVAKEKICRHCQSEWPAPDLPPTPDALTPTLRGILAIIAQADQLAYDHAMRAAGIPRGCGGCG